MVVCYVMAMDSVTGREKERFSEERILGRQAALLRFRTQHFYGKLLSCLSLDRL